jgi:hypothetical protein
MLGASGYRRHTHPSQYIKARYRGFESAGRLYGCRTGGLSGWIEKPRQAVIAEDTGIRPCRLEKHVKVFSVTRTPATSSFVAFTELCVIKGKPVSQHSSDAPMKSCPNHETARHPTCVDSNMRRD